MGQIKNISAVFVLFLLTSCNGCNKNKSREKPDTSGIKLQLQFLRFDKDLSGFRTNDFAAQVGLMREKYGTFYDFYIAQFVSGPQSPADSSRNEEIALKAYLTDAYVQRRQDSINSYFANTRDVEENLEQSLKYFKYYFPKITVPKVIAINSGLSLGAFTYNDDVLGIGLDLYLGPNNPDYDSAGIYQYLKHKMRREYITRNSMEVLYNLYFGDEELSRGKTLIEAMVDKGRKMYFLSYVLPDAPDSMIVGYTDKQVRWCEASEYDIWKFLNDKDLLYKDNYMEQKRYLDEGPTTTGMPPESPGNLGSWIGLQIVRKFMKETGNKLSLYDLITKYDSKTIVEKAKYRPAKSVF